MEVMRINQLPIPRIKLPTAFDLHRELNRLKQTELPWMYESSKWAPQLALRDLDSAFKNFYQGRAGFPRFKSRKHGAGSFTLAMPIHVKGSCIRLPRLGWIRFKEHGYLPIEAHINSATVSELAGRWFVSLNVVEEREDPEPIIGAAVGVDRVLKNLAVVSDGVVIENPKAMARCERKLKQLQRAVSRKQKGSSNRRKAVQRLARCHSRISNMRKDALHKATTALATTKSVIVVEDLAVRNMMANHHLAKAIGDAGWSEFVRQLEYKSKWYGSRLVVAGRFFPSTKRCSKCGGVKDSMSLDKRTFVREFCEFTADRDLNAALNLEQWPSVGRTLETPVEEGAQVKKPRPSYESGTEMVQNDHESGNEGV
jgi:putative transposase